MSQIDTDFNNELDIFMEGLKVEMPAEVSETNKEYTTWRIDCRLLIIEKANEMSMLPKNIHRKKQLQLLGQIASINFG